MDLLPSVVFKKSLASRRIAALGLLASLCFLPSCLLPVNVTTEHDASYIKGDRVSAIFIYKGGRHVVLLNPHDGVPFPKWSDSLTLIMTGEGEPVKTSSGEGRKFTRLNTAQDNLASEFNVVKTGYIILYEKNQSVDVHVKTNGAVITEFNGMTKLTKTDVDILLDNIDVPVIEDFFKARPWKRLFMIRNATGSVKGVPLRDMLISCLLRFGLYSESHRADGDYEMQSIQAEEVRAVLEKHKVSEKSVAILYLNRDAGGQFCWIYQYKGDNNTIIDDVVQALKRADQKPRGLFLPQNGEGNRDGKN